MKTLLLLALLFYFGYNAAGQTIIGRQLVDQYPIASDAKTYGLTWLPSDYNSTNKDYPLIIFLHAAGETGDNIDALNKLLRVGLPRKIAEGWDPQAVNPVDGKNYQFIVVSPQAPTKSGWSYSYSHVKNILPDVISRYRVDTNRIYLMGISAGGAGTWSSVTNDSNFTKKFAAILPVSSVGVNNPLVEAPNIKYISGKYGVKVWTVCGVKDVFYNIAASYVNTINTAKPAPAVPALLTGVPAYGHDTALWTLTFDASWRNNSIHLNFYEWMLQYQRDDVIEPPPPPNQSPEVDAGQDKSFALPKDTTKLKGSASDPDGTITSYQWTKISGPSKFDIDEPTLAETIIRNLVEGTYQFELKATDNEDASAKDTVTIAVLPFQNEPPVADAGSDQSITLPANILILKGAGTDSEGAIASYHWSKVAGPAQFNIVTPYQPQTIINNLAEGTYLFELTVTDEQGDEGTDTVAITVLPQQKNELPIVNAGDNQVILLPTDSVELQGMASDPDGEIISYQWGKVGGPDQFLINQENEAQAKITGLVQGIYEFELTVTDNNKAISKDTVVITVLSSNQLPVADAGKDQTVTLPEDSVLLSGSAIDEDGTIASYSWSKFSGPAQFTIDNSKIANPEISNLVAGTYTFRLTVIDNEGGTSTDDINIVVNPVPGDYQIIPGGIEAESYVKMKGIGTEDTWDEGGGRNVGWINDGDWIDFNVYVESSGMYTVNFRVATPNTGAKFQLQNPDGTVLAGINIPNTGNYQGWITQSVAISLSKGYQTLRVISTGNPGWNINWMNFSSGEPSAKMIPSKIEAENYDAMEGIQMEMTGDNGGGLDVGWINDEDWLDYNVNASSEGKYIVTFRIATPNTGAQLQIQQSDGTVLAKVDIPKTGGYQAWSNVSTTISLPKGEQTLRIISKELENWNINWLQFEKDSELIAKKTQNLSQAQRTDGLNSTSSFEVSPNPVKDRFSLLVNSTNTGTLKIQIADMQGMIRREFRQVKNLKGPQSVNLSLFGLPQGTYILRLQLGNWGDSKFIVKE